MGKKYVLGIYLNTNSHIHVWDKIDIALILKNRPKEQLGLYNGPGGAIESGESPEQAIVREFEEECGVKTKVSDWSTIGQIKDGNYHVIVLTSQYNLKEHGYLLTGEHDQPVNWFSIHKLPKNLMTNIRWMTYFAIEYFILKEYTDRYIKPFYAVYEKQ